MVSPSSCEPAQLSASSAATPNQLRLSEDSPGSAARARPERQASRPLSIASPTNALAAADGLRQRQPENDMGGDCARQRAAGPVQISRGDPRRGVAMDAVRSRRASRPPRRRRDAPLHQHRARPELSSARPGAPCRPRSGRPSRRAAPPPRRGWASGNRRAAAASSRTASTKPAPLSASPDEAVMTGS